MRLIDLGLIRRFAAWRAKRWLRIWQRRTARAERAARKYFVWLMRSEG